MGSPTNTFEGGNWYTLADTQGLVIIQLNYCPRGSWYHPYIDKPDPGPGHSDGPYLAAVIADASSNANVNIDATRLILTGGSSGGSLTWGIACDPTYSGLFMGYAPVSAAMQVDYADGGTGVPGTERCSGGTNFFLDYFQGTADGAVNYQGACVANHSHCIAKFTENEAYWSQRLGCGSSPNVVNQGTPVTSIHVDEFGGCNFGSPGDEFDAVTVDGGGHQREGLDGTNGFNTAQSTWDFFSTRHW